MNVKASEVCLIVFSKVLYLHTRNNNKTIVLILFFFFFIDLKTSATTAISRKRYIINYIFFCVSYI